MIKINLAKKMPSSGGSSFDFKSLKNLDVKTIFGSLSSAGIGTKIDLNGPIPKLILTVAACWFATYSFDAYKVEALQSVDSEIQKTQQEQAAVTERLTKLKGVEPLKKQLEDDERTIRAKIDVLNRAFLNRGQAVRLLMQIGKATPEGIWLTSVKAGDTEVAMQGETSNSTHIAEFIQALQGTGLFNAVNFSGMQDAAGAAPANTGANVLQPKKPKYQTFELKAQKRTEG